MRLLRPHKDYKAIVDELVKKKVADAKDSKEADSFKAASAVLKALSELDVSPKALATTPWTVFSPDALGMLFSPRSPLFMSRAAAATPMLEKCVMLTS